MDWNRLQRKGRIDMEHSNGRITAYIHLEAVEENFRRMKANLKEGVQMVAVIKTDAYGHGAVRIAKLVEPYPYIWGFAVAAVSEGLELRAAGITKPILILGYTFEEDYEAMIKTVSARQSLRSVWQRRLTQRRPASARGRRSTLQWTQGCPASALPIRQRAF